MLKIPSIILITVSLTMTSVNPLIKHPVTITVTVLLMKSLKLLNAAAMLDSYHPLTVKLVKLLQKAKLLSLPATSLMMS